MNWQIQNSPFNKHFKRLKKKIKRLNKNFKRLSTKLCVNTKKKVIDLLTVKMGDKKYPKKMLYSSLMPGFIIKRFLKAKKFLWKFMNANERDITITKGYNDWSRIPKMKSFTEFEFKISNPGI